MSDLSMRHAEHNVVATYATVEEARAALVMLERKGVEAGDIEVFGPGMAEAHLPQTNDEQREADEAIVHKAEQRGGTGFLVGALIGAGVGALLGWLVFEAAGLVDDMTTAGILGAALAGAIFAGFAGFFYGAATGLPVNEGWGETFAGGQGETSVAVHAREAGGIEKVVGALRGTNPRRLATCGRDGALHDVA